MFYLTFNLLRTIWVESVAQHITHTHTHTHNNIYIYIYIYICTHYVYSNTLRAPYARIVCFYYVHHAHLLSLSLSLSPARRIEFGTTECHNLAITNRSIDRLNNRSNQRLDKCAERRFETIPDFIC